MEAKRGSSNSRNACATWRRKRRNNGYSLDGPIQVQLHFVRANHSSVNSFHSHQRNQCVSKLMDCQGGADMVQDVIFKAVVSLVLADVLILHRCYASVRWRQYMTKLREHVYIYNDMLPQNSQKSTSNQTGWSMILGGFLWIWHIYIYIYIYYIDNLWRNLADIYIMTFSPKIHRNPPLVKLDEVSLLVDSCEFGWK